MSTYLHAFPNICKFIVLNLYVLSKEKIKKKGVSLFLSLRVSLSLSLSLNACTLGRGNKKKILEDYLKTRL